MWEKGIVRNRKDFLEEGSCELSLEWIVGFHWQRMGTRTFQMEGAMWATEQWIFKNTEHLIWSSLWSCIGIMAVRVMRNKAGEVNSEHVKVRNFRGTGLRKSWSGHFKKDTSGHSLKVNWTQKETREREISYEATQTVWAENDRGEKWASFSGTKKGGGH